MNLADLIFFDLDKIAFDIFCFDTKYDRRVSGFILCQDAPKITFLTPQANALVFVAISRNLEDKNVLTYFGGSHLRTRATVVECL